MLLLLACHRFLEPNSHFNLKYFPMFVISMFVIPMFVISMFVIPMFVISVFVAVLSVQVSR